MKLYIGNISGIWITVEREFKGTGRKGSFDIYKQAWWIFYLKRHFGCIGLFSEALDSLGIFRFEYDKLKIICKNMSYSSRHLIIL